MTLLRGAFFAATALLFLGSLLAIGITGPVVVRVSKLQLDVDVSPDRLRSDVLRLSGEFYPRDYRHPDNLDAVAEWIADEFRRAGLEVTLQDYEIREGRFRNVVGFRPGRERGGPVRVIGAHYDAYGELPGADDNASGVAALLELTRTLRPETPRLDQYFVAFSTEEPPFFGSADMGSAFFARTLVERDVDVDLMIALDGVGYFSDTPGSQGTPVAGLGLLYPRRGNFVAVVGDLRSGESIKRVKIHLRSMTDLPVHSFRGPVAIGGVDWSDHRSFRELDYPAVLITDTAFMRNPHYHTSHDTPETLDYVRLAEVVRGLHAIVWDRDVAD